MGLIPEQSFTVRKPAWWDTNSEYVLADYPGRAEAMRLSGHDFDVLELPSYTAFSNEVLAAAGQPAGGPNGAFRKDDGYVSHVHSKTLKVLAKSRDTFERIQNSVAYDVAELLFDQGFAYETGGTMGGGAINYLTLLLNEPIVINGDETTRALPFGCLSWAHDGSASLKVRSGTIVQVCQNTVSASEAEGVALGTQFTFRHTKNVMERIEDAKQVVKGLRANVDAYREVMEELISLPVTPGQRDLFVSTIIGDTPNKDGVPVSMRADTSERVKNNISRERVKIDALFGGPTVPEQYALTGYGLFQAGVEYFDHLRRFQSKDSYVKRTLLADNPAKANLTKTIREVVTV